MQKYLYWLVLLLLLPFVLLVLYVHPSLDDLSVPLLLRAGEGTRLDVFWRLMHHWNGRYTSNLLAVLAPTTWPSLTGYRLALLLQFPALYFALYYLLSRILSPVLSPALTRRRLHLLSAAILLIYLHWLPGITESIYWLSGAITYTWALIVQLLVLALMAASAENPTPRKTILLAVLLFVLCGFNEIALAVNLLLVVGYWLLGFGYWLLAFFAPLRHCGKKNFWNTDSHRFKGCTQIKEVISRQSSVISKKPRKH